MCGMAVFSIDVFILVARKIIIQQVSYVLAALFKCAAGFALWLHDMSWTYHHHHHTQIDRIDIDCAQEHELYTLYDDVLMMSWVVMLLRLKVKVYLGSRSCTVYDILKSFYVYIFGYFEWYSFELPGQQTSWTFKLYEYLCHFIIWVEGFSFERYILLICSSTLYTSAVFNEMLVYIMFNIVFIRNQA